MPTFLFKLFVVFRATDNETTLWQLDFLKKDECCCACDVIILAYGRHSCMSTLCVYFIDVVQSQIMPGKRNFCFPAVGRTFSYTEIASLFQSTKNSSRNHQNTEIFQVVCPHVTTVHPKNSTRKSFAMIDIFTCLKSTPEWLSVNPKIIKIGWAKRSQ